MKWPDGTLYNGDFENNEIHGFGTYVWGDLRTYEGNWVDGLMHGRGIYIKPN